MPSSFNKSVNVDLTIQGDFSKILKKINEKNFFKKIRFKKSNIEKWWDK